MLCARDSCPVEKLNCARKSQAQIPGESPNNHNFSVTGYKSQALKELRPVEGIRPQNVNSFLPYFVPSSNFFPAALPEYTRLLSSLLLKKRLKTIWSLSGLTLGCFSSHRPYLSSLSVIFRGRPVDFFGSKVLFLIWQL